MDDDQGYAAPIDHSQDITVRTNKEGKFFAIKNIRQEFSGLEMTLVADIGGDIDAGREYLEDLGKKLISNVRR